MFEEPVAVGLIRFADPYDRRPARQRRHSSGGGGGVQRRQEQSAKLQAGGHQAAASRFDLDHQPILVIYTSLAGEQRRSH